MIKIQLIEKGGDLYTPKAAIVDSLLKEFYSGDPIIICRHDAGDFDTIKFPAYNENDLRSALYDDREMGIIPNVQSVLLPDGKEFVIDVDGQTPDGQRMTCRTYSTASRKPMPPLMSLSPTNTKPLPMATWMRSTTATIIGRHH